MIRLSIIIPFYNVEKYISQCLDSVFNQDIPLDEYEVICVNDGSPDHSRDIVLDYMTRYPNLRLIEHEHNKKLGSARNTGRRFAEGKYIWNVDSDDMISPNCLGKMLRQCEDNQLDVLVFQVTKFCEDKEIPSDEICVADGIMSGLEYLNTLNSNEVSRLCGVWCKMIRREFLDENNIYSPEINMGEDVPYSYKTLINAQRMMVISEHYYRYRLNPDSLTGKNWVPTAKTLYEKCIVEPYNIYSVTLLVPDKYPNVKKSFSDSAKYMLSVCSQYLDKMAIAEQKQYRKLLRRNFRNNRFVFQLLSRKGKLKYILSLFV